MKSSDFRKFGKSLNALKTFPFVDFGFLSFDIVSSFGFKISKFFSP